MPPRVRADQHANSVHRKSQDLLSATATEQAIVSYRKQQQSDDDQCGADCIDGQHGVVVELRIERTAAKVRNPSLLVRRERMPIARSRHRQGLEGCGHCLTSPATSLISFWNDPLVADLLTLDDP